LFPEEALWERFLDRHGLSMADEAAFLEALAVSTEPIPATLESLEARYAQWRQALDVGDGTA